MYRQRPNHELHGKALGSCSLQGSPGRTPRLGRCVGLLLVRLGVAGTAETVNVTAATPIIDVKRESTTTNVTLEELQNIPTARDPWVVMQQTPSVLIDRVNVGGNYSGQQSNYTAKGVTGDQATWKNLETLVHDRDIQEQDVLFVWVQTHGLESLKTGGATLFDASCGGIGGCPYAQRATGNVATEDLVYLLEGEGIDTGVDLDTLIATSEWLEGVLGRRLEGYVYRAGLAPTA